MIDLGQLPEDNDSMLTVTNLVQLFIVCQGLYTSRSGPIQGDPGRSEPIQGDPWRSRPIRDDHVIAHRVPNGSSYSKSLIWMMSLRGNVSPANAMVRFPSIKCKVQERKREVGGKGNEARSCGRSSPDTLAFWACETPSR